MKGQLSGSAGQVHPAVRELADRVHAANLAADPFGASDMGVDGYDALVPNVSVETERDRRALYTVALTDAAGLAAGPPDDSMDAAGAGGAGGGGAGGGGAGAGGAGAGRAGGGGAGAGGGGATGGWPTAEAITLACVRATAEGALAALDARSIEYTVSASFGNGPAALIGTASRTRIRDESAARDWGTRVGGLADHLDDCVTRLRAGAADGRTPVRALVDTAIAQLDDLLADGVVSTFTAPFAGLDPDTPWLPELRTRVERDVATSLRPALARYRDVLRDELAPVSRPDGEAGLAFLPGGPESYALAVRVHTTLPLDAATVHRHGLDDVAADHDRMRELGSRVFGPLDLPELFDRIRRLGADPDVAAAMDRAREAVRRAESAAARWFDPPLPPPCAVEAMAPLLARAGMAPHYSPPSRDGSRTGTYWFNADRPGVGTGAELESVTYHETVPGHHTQLVRMLGLAGVPDLQRETVVTAHAEGWGLYAEVLAEEMGLYTDDVAVLGMLATDVFRAGRLVVDTGLHALGWTRAQALEWFAANVPLPRDSLAAEVDRYLAWPGQALAYKTGQREILRLREDARARLSDRFDIRGFHGAVLDSGSVPLPALALAVAAWVAGRG